MPIELVIGGVTLLPVIVGFVELAKRYGNLPDEHAPLLNGALTALAYALMVFVRNNPGYEEMVAGVLMGVVVFLANAGFYATVVKPHLTKKNQVTLGYMYSTTGDGERVFQEVRLRLPSEDRPVSQVVSHRDSSGFAESPTEDFSPGNPTSHKC